MKKYFITGLVILLPLAVTILIVRFFFNLLTEPFVGMIGFFLQKYHLDPAYVGIARLISQILILILLFFATVMLGMLTRWFFVHSLLSYGEKLLQRIPLISPVYKTCKDVIQTIFSDRSSSFKQVVLAPFPNPETSTLGLVTREDLSSLSADHTSGLVAVFVPTTPNPTSGFLVFFRPDQLTYLTMSVEEALKFIISCGVITAPFNQAEKKEPQKDDGQLS